MKHDLLEGKMSLVMQEEKRRVDFWALSMQPVRPREDDAAAPGR